MTENGASLLARAEAMPYGTARTRVTEQALRLADQLGDRDLAFEVRDELDSCYRYGGEPGKELATLVRQVAEFDAGYGRPRSSAAGRTRRSYKRLILLLLDHPEVGLPRIRTVLDEMERRYRSDAQNLHAVYRARHRLAVRTGAGEEAERWYATWLRSPRSENSDCPGCDRAAKVRHLARRGRDEDAIELAAQAADRDSDCGRQPQGLLGSVMMAYLRTGRFADALDAHRRAYRAHRGLVAELGWIASHVRFCALTGNEERGLDIVQRHLPWLNVATTPSQAVDLATGTALLLRRLPTATSVRTKGTRIEAGSREVPERMPAAELADRLVESAFRIAARFDARNENNARTEAVTRTLAEEPLVHHLEFAPSAVRHTIRATGPDPSTAVPELVAPDPAALLEAGENWMASGRTFDAADILADMIRISRQAVGHAEIAGDDAEIVGDDAGETDSQLPEFEKPSMLRRARYLLALAHLDLGEQSEALKQFEAGARAEAAAGDQGWLGYLLERAARVLRGLDREGEAADQFATAAEDYREVGDLPAELRCRRRQGDSLFFADREEAAASVFA